MLGDPQPRRSWRRMLGPVLAILIGAALGIGHNVAVSRGASDPVSSGIRTVLTPFVSAVDTVAGWFGRTTRTFFRAREVASENERLRAEVERLRQENDTLREAKERVERLEQLAGLVQSRPPRKRAARVIALAPAQEFGTLVIGLGRRDGIRPQAPVVAPEGLVGTVYEVGPTTSVVLLVTDPRASVGARVQRAGSRAVGVCRGLGGRELRCNYLAREADVRVGDIMVTSGLGGDKGVYPPGIVIGTVTSVREDLAMSAKTALVRAAADMSRLEEVAVLQ